MDPGRSRMIKAGMIDGKYKEPKLAEAYGAHGSQDADEPTGAKTNAKTDGKAAGCPF